MKKSIFGAITLIGLVACGSETSPEQQEIAEISAQQNQGLIFAQDGDTFNLKVGEEISIKLDLPSSIKNTAITWQPIDGWYDGPIEEFRTYRSLEGQVYYTDLQIRGIEEGQKTLTFAPAKQRQPVDKERRTLTFIVR
ncbi:MAG: hypothetical protein ABJN69_02460 [Hellea sp.]